MISTWCVPPQTVLGQVVCDDRVSEIASMLKLLEMLELLHASATADAMHRQDAPARKIIDGGGNYLLQVKNDRPVLHENLQLLFGRGLANDCQGAAQEVAQDMGAGHGRISIRRCWCSSEAAAVAPDNDWPRFRTTACIEPVRQAGQEKTSLQRHYDLSSHVGEAEHFLVLTGGRWGVENQLHWLMGVVFGEDSRLICKDHAAVNYARLSRIALDLFKTDINVKASIRT